MHPLGFAGCYLLSHLQRFSFKFNNPNLTPAICRKDFLAMKHLPDVCGYFSLSFGDKDFRLSHVSYSIRLITKRRLLFPGSYCYRPNGMPYGLPALRCIRRDDSFSAFRIIDSMEDLGVTLYAGSHKVPCRQVRDLHPTTYRSLGGAVFDLLILVGLYAVTTLKGFN